MSTLILVAGLVLILLVAVTSVLVVLRRVFRRRTAETRERFAGDGATSVVPANFFGQQSRGAGQVRGNGTLALTGTELRFDMVLPHREFRVPLRSIEGVETPRSHLGKSVGRRLLKVVYRNEDGQPDSMAWAVRDLETTRRNLESTISRVR